MSVSLSFRISFLLESELFVLTVFWADPYLRLLRVLAYEIIFVVLGA